MKVTFTTKGYIEVWWTSPTPDVLISRHKSETEAVESLTAHAAEHDGDQLYELRYPNKLVKAFGILNPGNDLIAPSQVLNLSGFELNASSAVLAWDAATDNVAVTGYQVWRDDVPIATPTVTTYTDTGLVAGTPYTYKVAAYDAAGNVGAFSDTVTITTSANSAPEWVTIAEQALTPTVAYFLDLGAQVSDADGDAVGVTQVSGTLPTGLTYNPTLKVISGTPIVPGTSVVVFRASDGTDTSDVSVTFVVSDADETSPSVPTNLAGTGISRQRIRLTWTASSDPTVAGNQTSGLAGYRLYRNGTLRAPLGLVTTYDDTGLSALTTYSYTLSAIDAAGNESAQCSAVQVVTLSNADPEWVTAATLTDFVVENSPFTVTLEATDDDGDALTFSRSTALPGDVAEQFEVQVGNTREITLSSAAGLPAGDYDFTYTVEDNFTQSDFQARATGPGVIWAHPFTSAAEVEAFKEVDGNYYLTSGGASSPYLSDHPDALLSHWEADPIVGGCVTHTNFGTRTAASIGVDDTVITLADATHFPDPLTANGLRPYTVVLQIESPSVSEEGQGRERLTVVAKSGSTITVVRRVGKSANMTPRTWDSGTRIGWDCEGSWSRPFSAFLAGGNGLTTDDNAAQGTANAVTRFDWATATGTSVANKRSRWKHGYYGPIEYHTKYDPFNGETDCWDGTEFYIQFRVKIDANAWHPENIADGKLVFFQTGESSYQQIVIRRHVTEVNETTSRFEMFTSYGDSRAPGDAGELGDPQGKSTGSAQPGGPSPSTCLVGDNRNHTGCWQWPADEWVTILMRIKSGHHNSAKYGLGATSPVPEGAITVDTTTAPTNDGTTLTFYTNIPPRDESEYFNGATYVDPQTTNGYFNGWRCTFRSGPLASSSTLKVSSYTITGGLARWTVTLYSGGTFPAGVPASGNIVGFDYPDLFDTVTGVKKPKYNDSEIQVWAAGYGESSYTQIYNKSDLFLFFGGAGVGDFDDNPPGHNFFQSTGYQNLQDGSAPPAVTYSYRFAEVIFSKLPIPCPQP